MIGPRSARRDLAILTLVCAVAYCFGLVDHGLTNWQEGMRAVAARDMQARGDWIVPTLEGRPYLAKPPMIYWCQLLLAEITGRRAGIVELRLTVALAGWSGVVALYLFTRRLLRTDERDGPGLHGPAWAQTVAWWSSLFLATGILYTRSSRIGELDILLAPFTIVAVGSIAEAWRLGAGSALARWRWIALAAAAAAGAALSKGPPALLVILLAAYGGMALRALCTDWNRTTPITRAISATLAGAGAIGALLATWRAAGDLRDWAGVAFFVLAGAAAGLLLGRLADVRRALEIFRDWSRTHPLAVGGIPLAVLWAWGRAVEMRIGNGHAAAAAAKEAADNLELLALGAPLNNLEAITYAVGAGSAALFAAVVWLAKDRPRPPMLWWIVFAWVGLNVVAFSSLGRGTIRYLTPVWPGIALLGGVWFASALRDMPARRTLARIGLAAVACLAIAQAWWYGDGRDRAVPHRSSRDFMAELLAAGADPSSIAALDFWYPELNYYADRPVRPVRFIGPKIDYPFPTIDLDALQAELAASGSSVTLLMRDRPAPGQEGPAPIERLRARGLVVEPLAIESRYLIDRRKVDVIAARVSAPASAASPAPAGPTPQAR